MSELQLGTAAVEAGRSSGLRHLVPRDLRDGLQLTVVGDGPLFLDAERFQYWSYLERGFCSPSRRERVEEVEAWRERSLFHVVHEGPDIRGVLRTITGSFEELPVAEIGRRPDGYPSDPCVEFASLAIARSEPRCISDALFRSASLHSARSAARSMVAIVETPLLRFLRRFYGFPFVQLGPSAWYMGGEVTPIGTEIADVNESLAVNRPEIYKWFWESLTPEEWVALDFPIVLD